MRTMTALLITIPKSTSWEDYEEELARAAAGEVLNFKVPNFPLRVNEGDRCYVLHRELIKGWMEIVGFSEGNFICSTTGKRWSGKFVQRSGEFHHLEVNAEPRAGFQGFRYLDIQVGVECGPFRALHDQ